MIPVIPKTPAPSSQNNPQPVLRLAGATGSDPIQSWLDVLQRLLRLSARESASIREELETHLRERTHDLLLTGCTEDQAISTAISELGDAASLAQRYRHARAFPRRRLMMNLSMFALAGGAVVMSIVALSPPGPGDGTRVSVFSPPAPSDSEQAALSKKFTIKGDNPQMDDIFPAASKSIGIPVVVVWQSLEAADASRGVNVIFTEHSMDFPAMLRSINEYLQKSPGDALDFRVVDGTVKVATENYFDRRETILSSYDLSALLGQIPSDEITGLLQTFVHKDAWEANGGDLARLSMVGGKMFVQAPRRYHAQIKWFLDELRDQPGMAAGNAEQDRKTLASVDGAKMMLAEHEKRMHDLTDANAVLQRESASLRDAMQAMRDELQDREKHETALQRQAQTMTTENEALQRRIADLEVSRTDQARALKEQLDKSEAMHPAVQSLERRLADVTAALKSAQDELERAKANKPSNEPK